MQETGFLQSAPDAPQRWGVPAPPQVRPSGHGSLQSSEPSQPSPIMPQYWPPSGRQVTGTQASPLGGGAPPPPKKPPMGGVDPPLPPDPAALASSVSSEPPVPSPPGAPRWEPAPWPQA